MHKPWLLTTALTLCAFAATGATAQEAAKPAAELLCSEVSTLEEAHAAALVYYIAGFVDGQQAASGTAPAGNPAMVGGITLSAAAVLEACAATPDITVADAIAAQGGSAGAAPAATETPAPEGEITAPADDAATPPAEGEATPPAEGTTAP